MTSSKTKLPITQTEPVQSQSCQEKQGVLFVPSDVDADPDSVVFAMVKDVGGHLQTSCWRRCQLVQSIIVVAAAGNGGDLYILTLAAAGGRRLVAALRSHYRHHGRWERVRVGCSLDACLLRCLQGTAGAGA